MTNLQHLREEMNVTLDNIEPRATVTNNNQKGWETIVEVKPFTTLMIDTKLYKREDLEKAFKLGQISGVDLERTRIAEEVEKNMSYAGVLDSNEKRRGYDIAIQEVLSIIKQGK